jgi:DNA-binding response OmpR family regulator
MLLLHQEGHGVRGVYSGREVLKAVREFDPDVVLLDIGMPFLSGWELARTIRERFDSRATLIAITGKYKQSSDRILSKMVGFDHYLVKPYEPQALMALIAQRRVQSGTAPSGA